MKSSITDHFRIKKTGNIFDNLTGEDHSRLQETFTFGRKLFVKASLALVEIFISEMSQKIYSS